MKQFYYSLLLLSFSFFVSAQEMGGTPVEGLIPIRRIDSPVEKPLDTNGEFSEMSQTQSVIATNTPTGNSSEVGITEGQLSVSSSGGSNYTIPIGLPPGINGVIPQVSLAYNSQGGNGLAGYGWNIAGISSITRIPSTKFHDGTIDAVDFDDLDRFAFDGQRLMIKNGTGGTYGANGTVYETENFSNVKITSYGVHPSGSIYGPAYFIVEYPDGSRAYYGNSTDSRSITNWNITYWENPQGVRISYYYNQSNNSTSISSIKYGSINANGPVNSINFTYKTRQRPEQNYVGGQSILQNTILSQISVTGNGVGFRNYVLNHETTSLGYERLVSITEKSGDNSKTYNPTNFSYETTPQTVYGSEITSSLSVGNITQSNARTVSGDFDGDGSMDFILFPTTGSSANQKYWIFNSITAGGSTNIGWEHNVGTFDEIFPVNYINYSNKLMPLQGYTVRKDNTFTTYALASYGIIQQAQKTFNFPKFELNYYRYCEYTYPNYTEVHYESEIPKKFVSGDFNGDGITDVVAIDDAFLYTYQDDCSIPEDYLTHYGGNTYFINLDQRIQAPPVSYSAGYLSTTVSSRFEVADFNGDGKSDIYVFDDSKVQIYTMNDDESFTLLFESTYDPVIGQNKLILFGDYNGDGKSDFIIPNGTGSNIWHKYSSTGTGLVKESQTYSGINFQASNSIYNYAVIPTDYNNDGKTDLLYTASSRGAGYNVGSLDVTCYINKNGVFSNSSGNYYSASIKDKPEIYANAMPIFLTPNQRNQKLELAFINSNKIFYFKSNKDFSKEQLLNSITNGNGVVENIYYKPLIEQSYDEIGQVYYNSSFTENYPNFDIPGGPTFQVVSKLEKISSSSYKKQLFTYYGAVTNMEGLGFLGFRATAKTNWFDGNHYMMTTVSKFDPNLRGANTESYTVLGYSNVNDNYSPSSFISKLTSTYTSSLGSNKVFDLKSTSSQQYNGLDNTSSETTSISYDSYNNPLSSTTYLKNGGATEQTTTSTVTYDNQPTGGTYYIGRPLSKNTSTSVSGDVMTSEELYTYTNNLLTQIKKKGNNTNYITEDNVYDSYGNITQKTISAPTVTARVTSYEYDASGRFLTKSTDIEGLATTFTYDSNNGTLQSETNPYGLTTSYAYDSWFKKTGVTDYLGKSQTVTYTRNGGESIIATNSDDGSASQEVFDDLGRKTQSGVKDISGNISYVSYEYDIYDRKVKVSEPYFGGSPSQWNETQYDEYGRMTQNLAFTGKTTNISYSGLTTTLNDGTKTKTSTKNAIGNVISMTDSPGGTINYTYFANGNLKSSNYDGVSTTIEQDGWGRKTKLTDPSAGEYTYTYNDLGEALTETTPNGSPGITTYTLNVAGKPTQKTISGNYTNSTTTYTYDGTTKLLTYKVYVDGNDNNATTTTTYTYDSSKRLSSTLEVTSYATFTKQFTYDSFGRVDTETSIASTAGKSSNKTVQHTYKNGQSWQITDTSNSQVLWQTNAVNVRGQLTDATMANGNIGVANTYDTYGFVTQTKQDRLIVSTGNIMTLNTAFDAQRGNLTSRTNSLFGWSESFTYDSLDRLTSFKNTTAGTETQNYDGRGRITENAVGTYNYTNSAKVYQNSSVTLKPDALTYYQSDPTQNISYNAFKSPYLIEEVGKDKISFTYNDDNNRSAMFYGNLDSDKLQRPNRKYYSADGTMEIKITPGGTEFVTYIGGDGYSAPLAVKSDGTTQNYLYLQRDYQGSIVAITDASGYVLEKRLFDAWGNVLVQDGVGNTLSVLTILDRGYTGHEHLQSVGLINMNGRIYDPKLHRFLQPDNYVQDPSNTQSYNRYGYCWNNPLKYADYNGEWFGWDDLGAALIGGVVNWATHGFQFNGAGAAYFGTGAAAGVATLYGGPMAGAAILGVGNSVTDQVSTKGNVDFGQLLGDTVMTMATSYVGGQLAQGISPFIDKTIGQVVTNSILKESLTQGVTNSIGGFLMGTTVAGVSGASFNDAINSGWSQAKFGFAMGAVNGAIKGYIDVKTKTVANADNATKSQTQPTTQNNTVTNINEQLPDLGKYPGGHYEDSKTYDQLVKQAQELYPKKAGKIELHHPEPQYLGGSKSQNLVPLDGAYHQVITNEFRILYPYRQSNPGIMNTQQIMQQVYSKYPIPFRH